MKKSQSSEYFNRLEKALDIDDEGNATFAKNLLADGTIGGNSGLTIIHTYKINELYSLNIYIENPDNIGGTNFIGCISNSFDEYYPCYGNYSFLEGTKLYFNAIVLVDAATGIFNSPEFWTYNPYEATITNKKFIFESSLSALQPKLYTHTLTLTADSKSYILIYQSTNTLNVNSITDLRTITNVASTSDNVILPVCLTDLSGTAALQITTAICKIGAANVTAVSDKVTTL